ncbi:hypothetical protein [Ponticaulis profundi]|uniref:DUF2306 domain-containing protein n=1 Tax=Ponticaulis profundi TaxID=2665222 RepID=A0ABW1SCJ9_9PROT
MRGAIQQKIVTASSLAVFWLVVGAVPAVAENLAFEPDAPVLLHIFAFILLYGHILGGAVGLLSGVVAIASPKGKPVHRIAGTTFFVSMFIAYLIGAGVAPFLNEGQRPNFVAGVMALYLLVTSWLAAKRPNPAVGWIEYVGLITSLFILSAGALFMYQGSRHPTGTVDGSPSEAFLLFLIVGVFAAIGDLHVIIRKKLVGVMRISRHLWRMCMSLFIAAGSFFLGQQQALPEFMVGTFWQFGPVLFPVVALIIWQVLVHLPKKPSIAANPAPLQTEPAVEPLTPPSA